MAIAALKMLTLDSSDAQRDATFWSAVLGWEVAHAQAEYAMLTGPGGMALGFGTLDDHEAPGGRTSTAASSSTSTWPSTTSTRAAAECVELGATLPDEQPGETWRVLLDPSGHPFCLTQAANWG